MHKEMNVGKIKNFFQKSSYNQICSAQDQEIGLNEFGEVRLKVKVDRKVYKHKIPDKEKTFLGIPLSYLSVIDHKIGIQQ